MDNKTPPKNEHDHGYKSLFSKKKNFMHFLRKYIGITWVNEIDEDDLILMNNTFILKDFALCNRINIRTENRITNLTKL